MSGVSIAGAAPSVPSLPSGVPASAQSAIAKGQSFYQQAAAVSPNTGLVGLMGAAASLVSALPPGQFTSAFSSAVSEGQAIVSAISEGAAIGGPYGAAAGACIAAYPRRWQPKPRCSPAPASPASCALPSASRDPARASS